MKKTILFTVIFPIISDYLDDYIQSIMEQTDQGFDWLIINDGIKELNIRNKFPEGVIWKDVHEDYTLAEIRNLGLRYAMDNNYEILIFADGDDYYTRNRIESIKKYLATSDFVFNEVTLVDKAGIELQSKVLQEMCTSSYIDSVNMLLDNNIIGLSNSALNLNCVNDDIYIPKKIMAVDWWLYSILVLNGKKGRFCPNAITYYRQTEINTVGMRVQLTSVRLFKGIEIKKMHYKDLREYAKRLRDKAFFDIYNRKYGEMICLEDALKNDQFCSRYIKVINDNFDAIYQGWWSDILPLGKWRQYAK